MSEREVRALLATATEDRPSGIDLMPAPRRRRVLVPALAGLGVAAAAGAIVLVLPGAQPSAQAQVAAAVANTSGESFHLHVGAGAKTFEGAFDPSRGVGIITETGTGAETRFVDDQMYIKEGAAGKWVVYPRPSISMKDVPAATALVKSAPLDPQAALEQLRSATDVKEDGTASGEGWTGHRFSFSLADTDSKAGKTATASGSVDVDDQGRVRRLEVVFADNGQRDVMDFTAYGTAVSVTAPPSNQVEQPKEEQGGKKPAEGS